MPEIVISAQGDVNPEALDASLRAALGAAFRGISLRRGQVIVHLAAEPDRQQIATARRLVQRHDPRQPGAQQRARRRRTQELQAAHADALAARQDDAPPGDLNAQLALLTRRINWLEKMLEALAADALPAG